MTAKTLCLLLATATLLGCGTSREVRKEEPRVQQVKHPPKPRSQREKVAVAEFEDRTNYGRGNLGTGASRVLTTMLVESQQFRVFEREKLEAIQREQQFQQSESVDPMGAIQLGRMAGVKYLVFGAVTKFGHRKEGQNVLVYQRKTITADCTVDVSVIDVETGEVVFVSQGDGSAEAEAKKVVGLGGSIGFDQTLAEDALRAAIAKMMDNLVLSMS